MIVVSNTSPITNLAAIGQLDLLRKLFGRVIAPDAVVQELTVDGIARPGAVELAQADWIRVEDVRERFGRLEPYRILVPYFFVSLSFISRAEITRVWLSLIVKATNSQRPASVRQ